MHHTFHLPDRRLPSLVVLLALCLLFVTSCARKTGPQWIETRTGAKIWMDCPSAPTNAIWTGPTRSSVADGEGTLTIAFKDGSTFQTNATFYLGLIARTELEPLSVPGWSFIGRVDDKGRPRGFGVALFDGRAYVGRFKSNGSTSGAVTEYGPDGDELYSGGFKRYAYSGAGSMRLLDGRRYEGGFRNGLQEGYGREWFPDGTRFKGYFKSGKRDGRGAETNAKGIRTWHVWRRGMVADRETDMRNRLDALGTRLSPKTKERFERYLCFYELNWWWMMALAGIVFAAVLAIGCATGPITPTSFVEELQREDVLRRDFRRGAVFGWHKMEADRPEWIAYPALVFGAFMFASKSILLFVPFPQIWFRIPTVPIASLCCLAIYAVLCIYDWRFGIGYDCYRFNWKWFWNPEYDDILRNGTDDASRVANDLRESAEDIRKKSEEAKREIESIFAELHAKHESDDNTLGIWATVKEAFGKAEEKKTKEMVAVVKRVRSLARRVTRQGKKAADSVNWFHVVFRRARNLSYEILDEARVRPVVRQEYDREFDTIDAVSVSVKPLNSDERISFNAGLTDGQPILGAMVGKFLDLGAAVDGVLNLFSGKETQLGKLRKDQLSAYETVCNAVPKIGESYALIREVADRLDVLTKVIQEFFVHYGNVREKLLGTPSLDDYKRRRHGYKGRDAVLSDAQLKAEFEPLLRFLMEWTKGFKSLDERKLGEANSSTTPTNTRTNA